MEKFYVTTAIPYVNARPHLGHALEFVQADVIACFHRQKGEDVLLLSGSDDNALKNVQAAEKEGVLVEEFVEENGKLFSELTQALGVQLDVFERGKSQEHHVSSQKLWELCDKAGDIYKGSYEGLYCVGCEAFYTREELDEKGECLEHPGTKPEKVSEQNYFFRLSKYQDQIVKLLERDELRIIPESRKNEVLSFLQEPLLDISVSRSNKRAKNWGVPVPGDESQRMYVWFDALNIYQSGVGFGLDEVQYKKWWPADVHVIGKGITRFHAVYWPAFLLSSGLSLPKTLFVHGYLTADGQKMSKTLGNVIDPFELIQKYGADAVRYFLLREIPSTEDGDYSREKFEARYNSDLAGGLGNLVSRVLTLAQKSSLRLPSNKLRGKLAESVSHAEVEVKNALGEFRFASALEAVWKCISSCDKYVEETRPWEDPETKGEVIEELLLAVEAIGKMLEPFLPETSKKIASLLKKGSAEVLFPRLSA